MVSRRNFISHSASAVAAGLILPSILNESRMFARNVGANDKINVGLIGCKGMGWSDLSDFLLHPDVDCVATNLHFKDHVTNFLDCMKSRNTETACPIDNGSLCTKYAHLGNISARVKSALIYDDVKKTFHNADADKLIKPEYRKPWKFPKI